MDINLGKGKDGIDLADDILREHRIPVVYVTAYSDDTTLDRAKKTHPFGYINKPIRPTDLRTTIALALDRAAADEKDSSRTTNADFWKLRCLCGPGGRPELSPEALAALERGGHASIDAILPANHSDHVRICLRERRQIIRSGRAGSGVYSWEYRPADNAAAVELTITDVTEHAELVNQNIHNASLSEALDRLATGVFFVNESLKVFYTNKSAARIIGESPNMSIRDGFLHCGTAARTAELQRLALQESGSTVTLDRGGGLSPLHLLVSPLHSHNENYGKDLPITIVYMFETLKATDRIEEVIRCLYNLSPTESRIAARLVLNPHVDEVANDMGITYNTARTHLKRIYAKTNINRLSSLIHMIVTGPVGVLLHSAD